MDHFRVEPVYPMDAHSGGAHLTFTIGFIFSGVVDKAQIESAVQKVTRAWPVLGTRLRRPSPDSPVVEALVPDAENAVLTTTFLVLPKRIHEVESLPIRTQTISTQRLTRNLDLYFDKPQPTTEEFISSQSPAFRLHVSCLVDATTFTLTFPHVLMDASGAGTVMRGLISVLEGKELLSHLEGDPWTTMMDKAEPRPTPNLRGWTTYGPTEFIASAESERVDLENDGPIQQRTVYFPSAEVERLKQQAINELEALGLSVPFLSSGDVVVAWLYKHFYGDERYSAERTSRLIYVLDARLHLPEIFTPDQVYLKNGYLLMVADKYANSQVHDMSLGEIARMVRELVIEHSKRETILDHLQWKFDHVGAVQVPAPAGERVMFASNWLTFGFGEMSISNVIRPGSGTGEVLDTYWWMPGIPRCSGCITFRDTKGGIRAIFDWAESNWTSGDMGEYAIEKLTSSPVVEEKESRLYALLSWWYRLVAWH